MLLEADFTWAERRQAEREGWGMFESDSRGLEIEADTEMGIFVFEDDPVDAEARRFVRARARAGSRLHTRALALHQRQKRIRRWFRFHNRENVQCHAISSR